MSSKQYEVNSKRRKQIVQKNPHAANFADLIVYQKARAVSKDMFFISKQSPKEAYYSLFPEPLNQ